LLLVGLICDLMVRPVAEKYADPVGAIEGMPTSVPSTERSHG